MRKILAIWAAKLSAVAGIVLGKKSSSGPGTIALKICPDIIERLAKKVSGKIIVTCGTNGKTTTNNLMYAALTKCGYKVICNRLGANMLSGIATAFALECDWLGRVKADYACLEVDEAFTVKLFDHLKPDCVVITNLFRDQLDRYGEVDATVNLLNKAFSKLDNPMLVLNADDPNTAQFGKGKSNVVYYGVDEKVMSQPDDSKEGRFCVFCGKELEYNYIHYSQLGDYHCPECGNKRPEPDYAATGVDLNSGLKFSVNGEGINLNYRGFYNIYNVLAVYSAVKKLGVCDGEFNSLLDDYKPQIGRMEEMNLGKPVILNLAKNPAGFNQAISTVLQDSRKKDVIIAVNDNVSDGQDVSWMWDVEFEKLDRNDMNTLSVGGIRRFDLALRFKYSDIRVDMVSENMREMIKKCLESDAEVCYVLVNYTELFSTQTIMLDLKKEADARRTLPNVHQREEK